MVCQMSAQDNVSYEFRTSYLHFRSKSGVFVVLIGAKVIDKIFVLTRVLFVTTSLTIVLRCEVKIQPTP